MCERVYFNTISQNGQLELREIKCIWNHKSDKHWESGQITEVVNLQNLKIEMT